MKKRYFIACSCPDYVNIQEVGTDGDVAYDKFVEEESDEETYVSLFAFDEGAELHFYLGSEAASNTGSNTGEVLHSKGGS